MQNPNKLYKIYLHENLFNHKKYIGQTCRSVCERFGCNGSHYINSPKFYNAIQKYGWENFSHKVLEENLTLEEANEREKYYIALYNTVEDGYNIYDGGLNTNTWEETRAKISKSQKIRLSKNRELYGGYAHSPETRKKLSESVKKSQKRDNFCGALYLINGKVPDNIKLKISQTQKKNMSIKEICPYCKKEFSKIFLNRHIKNSHSDKLDK